MNAQRSKEPQEISFIRQCVNATIDYYYSLMRLFILHTCSAGVYVVNTPASAALFMVMVPAVQYIYTRRFNVYMYG